MMMSAELPRRTKDQLHIKVFISSPGDVYEERRIAQGILNRLPQRPMLRERVFIETVAWDDPNAPAPLIATETPQDSVNRFKGRPSECDLTIVILWSRLGTALPPDERKRDGSTYASGTEWEFEDARNAGKEIFLYHRTGAPPDLTKVTDLTAVQEFLNRLVNQNRGINNYESPSEFATLFELNIETYLREKLDIREAAELDQYRFDFSDDLRLADDLVGRADIFAMIKQFEASHQSGYFRLTAEAGLGKTTLAAAVAKRAGAISFFTSASRGLTRSDQCLNHLSAELITRCGLPYNELPVRAGDDSSFLEKVLREAVEKASSHLWLVIDALDEADAAAGRNVLMLPRTLPEGVFCFVTQRPGDYPLETGPLTSITDQLLTWDSEMQTTDILAFLTREVSRPEISGALKSAIPGRDESFFVAELARMSEGNFMYLSYLLGDIANGDWSFNASDGPAVLPKGLRGYYEGIWSRMDTASDEWRNLYRPIIGLLAVAREPVTVSWLADVSGCDPEDIQNPVLSTWRRFLHQEHRNGTERWRILHRSFGDFLDGKLILKRRHAAVGLYYREPARWPLHDGYASRHLSSHLRAAEDIDGLSHLIDDPNWYESQMAADPSGVRYELDIREAWSLAAAVDLEAADNRRATHALDLEIKAALLTSTIAGFWTNMPADFITTLLEMGILSDVQALTFIARMNDSVRSRAIVAISPLLSQMLVPSAIEAARLLDAEYAPAALLALARRLADDKQDALLNEALIVAKSLADDNDSKPQLLYEVALNFSGQVRTACLDEAKDLTMKVTDPFTRAELLARLVGQVPEALDLLKQALIEAKSAATEESASAEEVDYDKGETLAGLVELVPAEHRPDVARQALAVALGIQDPAQKVNALKVLVYEIPEVDRESIALTAIGAARSLDDPADKADRLMDLRASVGKSEQPALLFEVEQGILNIADPESQATRLLRLAGLLPEEQGRQHLDRAMHVLNDRLAASQRISVLASSAEYLSGSLKDVALESALKEASNLADRLARARALIEIGQAWSGDHLQQLVREAAQIPAGILAIGQPETDDVERLELLSALMPEMDPAERNSALMAAKAIAEAVARLYDRARALASLLPHLEPDDRLPLVKEIKTISKDLDAASRAELLTKLIPYLSGKVRSLVIRDAVLAARSIAPGEIQFSGTINMLTGVVSIDRSPSVMGRPALALLGIAMICEGNDRSELIQEALESLRNLPARLQPELLAELSPNLSAAQIRPLLDDYKSILRDPLRDALIQGISERLGTANSTPPVGSATAGPPGKEAPNEETVEEVQGEQGHQLKFTIEAHPLSNMFGLTTTPNQAALEITYDPPPVWASDKEKENTGCEIIRGSADGLLAETAEEVLSSVYEDAQRLRGSGWQQVIGRLLQRLAATDSAETALAEARAIWPDSLPPVVAASVASFAPTSEKMALVEETLAAISALDGPTDRATVLTLLAPHLAQAVLATAVENLNTAVGKMSDVEAMTLLKSVGNQFGVLPPAVLLTLVQQVLRSTEKRRDLFVSLREMLPPLKLLGGPNLFGSLANLVLTATSWVR